MPADIMNARPILIAALFLSACGTTVSYIPTNRPPHAMTPRPVETVDVYSASAPSRPFTEVGMIDAQQSSRWSTHDRGEVFAKLRQRAASLGCDGVIILGPNDEVVGSTTTTVTRRRVETSSDVGTLKGYHATCIMYVAGQPVAAQ
jgi:hypothetical protein